LSQPVAKVEQETKQAAPVELAALAQLTFAYPDFLAVPPLIS
jgi:hypothetical protein